MKAIIIIAVVIYIEEKILIYTHKCDKSIRIIFVYIGKDPLPYKHL
jgi:hypothetical protein